MVFLAFTTHLKGDDTTFDYSRMKKKESFSFYTQLMLSVYNALIHLKIIFEASESFYGVFISFDR